jgi:hypothetical protein
MEGLKWKSNLPCTRRCEQSDEEICVDFVHEVLARARPEGFDFDLDLVYELIMSDGINEGLETTPMGC